MCGCVVPPRPPGWPGDPPPHVWWWLIPVALIADCLDWSFTMVVVVVLVWLCIESRLFKSS